MKENKRGPRPKLAPKIERPEPPKDLDPEGQKAWKQLCDDLTEAGKLAHTDRNLIELYARTYSIYRRCETKLANEELTLVAENGRLFINPLANQLTVNSSRLRQILSDCGLTPKSRGSEGTAVAAGSKWEGVA